MSGSSPEDRGATRSVRELALGLDNFGWEAIAQESARLGVSEEELIAFAVLYYLADLDSGRVARRPPGGRSSDQS